MEEEKNDIIKFEMPKLNEYFYKNYHKGGLLIAVVLFIFLLIFIPKSKENMTYAIQNSSIFCGALYILVLIGVLKTRRSKLAYELTIDKEKKEFRAYIYNFKKEIRFLVKDIKEVRKKPTEGEFRFYLNDGTWMTWDSQGTNRELLEQIIKSFGLSLNIRAFW